MSRAVVSCGDGFGQPEAQACLPQSLKPGPKPRLFKLRYIIIGMSYKSFNSIKFEGKTVEKIKHVSFKDSPHYFWKFCPWHPAFPLNDRLSMSTNNPKALESLTNQFHEVSQAVPNGKIFITKYLSGTFLIPQPSSLKPRLEPGPGPSRPEAYFTAQA